jgi:hypothetical protein
MAPQQGMGLRAERNIISDSDSRNRIVVDGAHMRKNSAICIIVGAKQEG